MIVIDTNLLVYAHRAGAPEHDAARAALESARRRDDGWGIAFPSVLEFWSVVTHPGLTGGPSTPVEARGFLDALVEADARLLPAGSVVSQRILDTAERLGVVGRRIFDLHVAAVALHHGATELWSHDRGFVAPPGLRLVDPIDVAR